MAPTQRMCGVRANMSPHARNAQSPEYWGATITSCMDGHQLVRWPPTQTIASSSDRSTSPLAPPMSRICAAVGAYQEWMDLSETVACPQLSGAGARVSLSPSTARRVNTGPGALTKRGMMDVPEASSASGGERLATWLSPKTRISAMRRLPRERIEELLLAVHVIGTIASRAGCHGRRLLPRRRLRGRVARPLDRGEEVGHDEFDPGRIHAAEVVLEERPAERRTADDLVRREVIHARVPALHVPGDRAQDRLRMHGRDQHVAPRVGGGQRNR